MPFAQCTLRNWKRQSHSATPYYRKATPPRPALPEPVRTVANRVPKTRISGTKFRVLGAAKPPTHRPGVTFFGAGRCFGGSKTRSDKATRGLGPDSEILRSHGSLRMTSEAKYRRGARSVDRDTYVLRDGANVLGGQRVFFLVRQVLDHERGIWIQPAELL